MSGRCDECEGRGVQVIPAHMLAGHEQRRICPRCGGSGKSPGGVLRWYEPEECDEHGVPLDWERCRCQGRNAEMLLADPSAPDPP